MVFFLRNIFYALLLIIAASRNLRANAQLNTPEYKILSSATVEEQLGAQLDLSTTFTKQDGHSQTLKQILAGDVPVLLTLNYYQCRSLCTMHLNGLVEGLKKLSWKPGENFRIVTISISPKETAELASAKRDSYQNALGRGPVSWDFYVGSDEAIHKVADVIGFRYKYDEEQDQYSHPAAIYFVTPEGKVSRYLYGITYPAQELKFAIMETAEGRVGSPLDKLILRCFHYDGTLGKYTPVAMNVMRLAGGISVAALATLIAVLRKKERSKAVKFREGFIT